jgi:acetyltransferase-like isoleucine patch superfamily enzyme
VAVADVAPWTIVAGNPARQVAERAPLVTTAEDR